MEASLLDTVHFLAVTYGHDIELKTFINSIRSQENPSWSLTIVHDGPNENLKKSLISEGYLSDPRINFEQTSIRLGKYGHPIRRKYLQKMPDDGYVVLTNGDNYYVPRLVGEILNNGSDFIYWDFKSHHSRYLTGESKLECNKIDMGCVAIKSNIAKNVGFNSVKFAADWDYFNEVIKSNKVKKIAKIDGVYFIHN